MKKLTEFEVNKKLENLVDWDFYDNALHTDFEFDNFKDCMSAMNRIAFECEELNHHPEWTNVYNTLDIKFKSILKNHFNNYFKVIQHSKEIHYSNNGFLINLKRNLLMFLVKIKNHI